MVDYGSSLVRVIPERLALLPTIQLDRGSHNAWEDGHCAMEVVAWLTGEPHTDRPACVSPGLAEFVRRVNDELDDEGRQRLVPFLPRMVGTAGDGRDERRGWMCVDWMVRVYTPAWLDLAGCDEAATGLRVLPEITGRPSVDGAHSAVSEAREDANDAWREVGREAGVGKPYVAWPEVWATPPMDGGAWDLWVDVWRVAVDAACVADLPVAPAAHVAGVFALLDRMLGGSDFG